MKLRLCAGLPIVLALAGVAHSQDRGIERVRIEDPSGREVGWYSESHALLVGISEYVAPEWPDLSSVPGELDRVQRALVAQGFEIERVENPSGDDLEEAFEDFIDQYGLDTNNRLLFFFAGHGFTRKDGEKGYLVGADAPDPRSNDKEFVRRSLSMSRILNMARNLEARHALFLFDSCFSGTVFTQRALPEIPRHITPMTAQPVRQFITAGSAGEQVPAKSVFVDTFIRALEGEGDLNRDGFVTGTELGQRIMERVIYYDTGQTPQFGKIRDPDLDRGDFVFRVAPGAADYNCAGQDKEDAERTAIEAYNYGRLIGLGIAQLDASELSRLEQDYNRLTPACQRYVDSIGERLNEMVEAGRIRDQIDKLPW